MSYSSSSVVYIFNPTPNHNSFAVFLRWCSLFISSILHQTTTRTCDLCHYLKVVYIFNPTPNHNFYTFTVATVLLFISSILHQTTTLESAIVSMSGCLYLQSYTKPHPLRAFLALIVRCLYIQSYTKPQLSFRRTNSWYVVYIFNPTPNHNGFICYNLTIYVVYIFNPTPNHNADGFIFLFFVLFISSILHQTTTCLSVCVQS